MSEEEEYTIIKFSKIVVETNEEEKKETPPSNIE